MEARSGPVFSAADIVTFVVDHLDDVLIPILAGALVNWLTKGPLRSKFGDRGINFTMKETNDPGQRVIINVTGDGNWVQLYPPPQPGEEE